MKQAIKATFDYAAKYGGKLTTKQLRERLISDKKYGGEVISHWSLVTGCKFEPEESKIFRKKLERARDLVGKLKIFEDILMVGVTGSVAAGWPKNEADIDLLIVCKSNTLWLTRLRLMTWAKINKITLRRFNINEKGNEFCFNIWIDGGALEIPKNKQNLRSAMDLVMMIPLLDRENTYQKFLVANDWAKRWVATGYELKKSKVQNLKSKSEKTIKIIMLINWVAFWGQYWYMKPKMKREIVDLRRAYFHPEDY